MVELGREFDKDNDELREELQTLLKNMVGDGAYGEGDVLEVRGVPPEM